jgi:hypothetical protein
MPKDNFLTQNKTTLIIVLLIIITALIAYPYLPKGQSTTINVQGQSEISVEPDIAKVWAGVSIIENSAELAQKEVNERISDIINELKEKGIKESDIETERLNLYEEKSWTEQGPKSEGWRATQILKIKTADMNKTGNIVDIAVSNGANQIDNIEFTLSEAKQDEYKNKAIAQATANAKEKAEIIAESLDARLGKIVSVSESTFDYIPYRYGLEGVAVEDAVKESAQVTPRDVIVSANIQLIYEIR